MFRRPVCWQPAPLGDSFGGQSSVAGGQWPVGIGITPGRLRDVQIGIYPRSHCPAMLPSLIGGAGAHPLRDRTGDALGPPASRRPVPSCSWIMWRWLSRATRGRPKVAPVKDWLGQIGPSAPHKLAAQVAALRQPASRRPVSKILTTHNKDLHQSTPPIVHRSLPAQECRQDAGAPRGIAGLAANGHALALTPLRKIQSAGETPGQYSCHNSHPQPGGIRRPAPGP